MEDLIKTIKRLNADDFEQLIIELSGNRKTKPAMVLEALRNENKDEEEIMEMLQVNRNTFYTLKSRLNTKLASILAKKVDNPIRVLQEEVAQVSANLYGTNKTYSIRALKELEKQLQEYDLNNELIIVYKTLARLHLHSEEHAYFENEYNKRVAFSLAVVKTEDQFFDFTRIMGNYLLTRDEHDLDSVKLLLSEMFNKLELYESHRMYVMYNIINLYYLCNDPAQEEELKHMEMKVENTLNEINKIFEKFPLDTFYQYIKPLTDFLFVEYYIKTGNYIRAEHYQEKLMNNLPQLAARHIMAFYVVQFLNSKVRMFQKDQNLTKLTLFNNVLNHSIDIAPEEFYHFYAYQRFLAVCKFYEGDYNGTAKLLNQLRNSVSFKSYTYTDVECKLFQALQYCILGDETLCNQLIQSIKRQINDGPQFEEVHLYIKLLKTALKTTDFRRKIKRLTEIWETIQKTNRILWFVNIDESLLRRMANPIK